MTWNVVMSGRAQRDVRIAESFLLKLSSRALARWRTKLDRIIGELEIDPKQYPESLEAAELGINLREANYGRWPHVYRVLFVYDNDLVLIHRIRHSSRESISETDLPLI